MINYLEEAARVIQNKINVCNIYTRVSKQGNFKYTIEINAYKELKGMLQLCKAIGIDVKVKMDENNMLYLSKKVKGEIKMELIQILAAVLGNKNIELIGIKNNNMIFMDQFGKRYSL